MSSAALTVQFKRLIDVMPDWQSLVFAKTHAKRLDKGLPWSSESAYEARVVLMNQVRGRRQTNKQGIIDEPNS